MAKRKMHVITEPYDPNKLEDCKIYVILKVLPTPTMWGKNTVEVSKDDLELLKTGKYKLWFSDGEYAHEIHLKEEEE